MLIGKNIRYLRKLNQQTQKWLADQLGKKSTAIGAYEDSKNLPPIDVIVKICEIYDVSIDQLVHHDLQAESYSPVQSSDSRSAYKNDELLNKLLAMKILEVAEMLKKKDPEEYERLHLASLSKTVQGIIDEE